MPEIDRQVIADLVVTHPRAGTHPEHAFTAGSAAADAHAQKLAKYESRWSFPSHEFVPLAMETGGRLHPDFRGFLRTYVLYAVGHTDDYSKLKKEERADYSKHMRRLLTSISVAAAIASGMALLYIKDACAAVKAPPGYIAAPTQLATQVAGSGATGPAPSSNGSSSQAAAVAGGEGAPAGAPAPAAAAN